MPGEKGLVAGRSFGLHDVPGESARGGPEHVLGLLDVETSMGVYYERDVDERERVVYY
jgi:hypothetical protein